MKTREIRKVFESVRVIEGAGVRLNRVFGYHETPLFDPFLLLDHFQSDNPDDFMSGFPWHPHRGIETVTYMLKGQVEHGDSLGNKGIIGPGDVQWMTAGSGIVHQEMPHNGQGIHGFQLWVNLPARQKMMPPRYQEINKEFIPETNFDKCLVKILCGQLNGIIGPVQGIPADPMYLDIMVPSDEKLTIPTPSGWTVSIYVYQGTAQFKSGEVVEERNVILFEDGDRITILSGMVALHFLMIAGKPLNEPIAWQGPVVMNNEAEIKLAFEEFHKGTFIKREGGGGS